MLPDAQKNEFQRKKAETTKALGIWNGAIRDRYGSELTEFRETMRNIGIISGTIAAGSLVLLSTPIQQVHGFIILGVIFLFGSTIVAVHFLLDRHDKTFDGILNDKHSYIDPIVETLKIFEGVERGEKTTGEAIEKHKGLEKYFNGKTIYNSPINDNEYKKPHGWKISKILMTIGISLILIGLLLPYLKFCL